MALRGAAARARVTFKPRCRLPVEPGSLAAGPRRIEGESFHYLARVRRLSSGDPVELFDGAGLRARAEVVAVERDHALLEVGAPAPAPVEATLEVTAFVALIKGDRMELCVQKLTELGVARIVPMSTARTVVKLAGHRAASRRDRLQSIARDAARQCGRVVVPEVAAVAPLPEALAAAEAELRLLIDERGREQGLRELLGGAPLPGSVAFAVGPEGGFEPAEVETAHRLGFRSAGLGPRILRAETAVLAVMAALQWSFGDLGAASP